MMVPATQSKILLGKMDRYGASVDDFRYRGYEKKKARGPSERDMKKLEERKKKEAARRKLVKKMVYVM